jgi:hypothetical protein
MLTAVGLFVVILGLLAGIEMHGVVLDAGRAAERERTQVEAVLVSDVFQQYGEAGAAGSASRTARYTDPAGQQHQVVLTVPGSPPAGTLLRVWVDRDGTVTAAPLTHGHAVVLGVTAALALPVVGSLVLLLVWMAIRRRLDRCNEAGWAREWARVEPEWSGRDR